MKEKKTLERTKRIALVFGICAVDILWAAYWLYCWKSEGRAISVRDASNDIWGILGQNLTVAAAPSLLFAGMRLKLKSRFASEMALKISGTMQKRIVGILAAVLAGVTGIVLATKADKGSALYGLLYYTVFIAFTEEFVVRGVCVYILREEDARIRYLVPNLLFAGMHIFSYAQWGGLTAGYVFSFITSQMLGLVAMGCGFQYLKEKTGTLWVPVLVHVIMDYAGF